MIVALTAGTPAKLNHARGKLAVQNQGAADIRIGRTSEAVAAGDGVLVDPRGYWETPEGPEDAGWSEVWVVSAAAGTVWYDRVGA